MSTPKKSEVKVTPATKVAFKCVRPNGKTGPKTDLLALVPRKGTISYKVLFEKAEAEGFLPPHIKRFVERLARDGHVILS